SMGYLKWIERKAPSRDPATPCSQKGGFLGWRDAISRRGGRRADVGVGALVAARGMEGSALHEAQRAATRAPTPLHPAPAPTRSPHHGKKPTPESLSPSPLSSRQGQQAASTSQSCARQRQA